MKPGQIIAAAKVLQGYFPDSPLQLGAVFLEALDAYEMAGDPKKPRARKAMGEAQGFDAFYTAYPRRVGRRAAAMAYATALNRSTPEIVLAGCKKYAETVKGCDPKYIKHPATWLNGDHWKDELGQMAIAGGTDFEDCSTAAWVRRLEVWAGKTEEPRHTWRTSWGPPPRTEGCKVPESAKKEYLNLYPPKSNKTA